MQRGRFYHSVVGDADFVVCQREDWPEVAMQLGDLADWIMVQFGSRTLALRPGILPLPDDLVGLFYDGVNASVTRAQAPAFSLN